LRRSLALLAVLALSLAACGADDPDLGAPDPDETVDPADDTPDTDADDDLDDPPADDATLGGGPQPDPDALADPCEPHRDREDEAFLDVVSPAQDQQVSEGITLVGCSNVFEATVQWRLLDGDGETLDEGFTTAECGSGCVGAFEEDLALEGQAADEPYLYLQVFWEDMSDGSERDLVEVGVVVAP
jgi:predicted small lipoprotein YifL